MSTTSSTSSSIPLTDKYLDAAYWHPKCHNFEIIDWNKWDAKNPRPPQIYNPPQFSKMLSGNMWIPNFWSHRAMACCAPLLARMCIPWLTSSSSTTTTSASADSSKLHRISDDTFLQDFLHVSSDSVPDVLDGVFWMKDNLAPETLLTMQNWAWLSNPLERRGIVALGTVDYDWTHDPTCWGMLFIKMSKGYLGAIQMHPNGKWISLATFSDPNNVNESVSYYWMYVIQPDDVFYAADGVTPLDYLQPGDLIRVTWNAQDPYSCNNETELSYLYTPRRIARRNKDNGELEKIISNLDDLRSRATGTYSKLSTPPQRRRASMFSEYPSPACGGLCTWNMTPQQRAAYVRDQISDWQVWNQSPVPPTSDQIERVLAAPSA